MNLSILIAASLDMVGFGRKKIFKVLQELTQFHFHNITYLQNEFYQYCRNQDSRFDQLYRNNEELFAKSKREGIESINYFDNNYPPLLKKSNDPPLVLYYKGNLDSLLIQPTVALIGTREPSAFGYKIAERLGGILGGSNITIVSGLAKGCDKAGHTGCIKANGRTVAVLAQGLDYIYPKENTSLADDIILKQGCLITEYKFGYKPFKSSFVERDRIQSGLSLATIVIETDINGGTMHTVRFTQENNRPVYCINHPLNKRNDKSKGNEWLLNSNKALPLSDSHEISNLEYYLVKQFNLLSTIHKDKIGENAYSHEEIFSTSNQNVIYIEDSATLQQSFDFIDFIVDKASEPKTEKSSIQLTKEQLAERIKVKRISTINKHIEVGDFEKWVAKKDPERKKWRYDHGSSKFIEIVT